MFSRFALCCSPKAAELVIAPTASNITIRTASPIVDPVSNITSDPAAESVSVTNASLESIPEESQKPVRQKHLLLGATAGLPLNKVDPPTPDLTPDEIAKIQANLKIIKEFSNDLWKQQDAIISEVWAKIEGEVNQARKTTDHKLKDVFENLLTSLAFVAAVAGVFAPPPFDAIITITSLIVGTTSSLLSTNGSSTSASTGCGDVSSVAGTYFETNNAHHYSQVKLLDFINDNTNLCRDYIFTFSKTDKSTTLRALIDIVFTKGTYYDNLLLLMARVFRRNVALTELIKDNNQFLDLYFIQDSTASGADFGHVFQPCAAIEVGGLERTRSYRPGDLGRNAQIWNNDDVLHYRKGDQSIQSIGTMDIDLKQSWRDATADYISRMPSAFIYPWAFDDKTVYTQKYYIIMGFAKMRDNQNKPEYNLASTNFLNWLFIDDGVGTIVNPNGVAFRYDVFRTKQAGFANDVFLHAQQISDGIMDVQNPNWTMSCEDFKYGPANSTDTNKKFSVYTGDILLANAPQ